MADGTDLAAQVEGQTVVRWLRRNVAECGDEVALRRMRPDGTGLEEWTWAEVGDRSARLAAAFGRLGLGRGERVLLFLRNRPEFHVADLGALLAGGTPLSIYNSSAPEQVAYLAGHSRARIAVVEDIELPGAAAQGPRRAARPARDRGRRRPGRPGARRTCSCFADLLRRRPGRPRRRGRGGPPGRPGHDHLHLRHDRAAQGRDARPTPTSGRSASATWRWSGRRRTGAPCRTCRWRTSPSGWSPTTPGCWQRTTVTCCPDQSDPGRRTWSQVRPTDLFGPPRVFEKLKAGIEAAVAAAGPEKAAGFEQAQGGRPADRRAARGRPAAAAGAGRGLGAARRGRVRADPRQRSGSTSCSYCFSGAAPLPVDVMHFLRSIGLPFSEVYGMSENTGGDDLGAVPGEAGDGRPALPGVEVRHRRGRRGALPAARSSRRGYLDDPERSAETFDADGWLHTGDIGSLDEDGYLSIVDRKKELIITAGGKNISPANLEALLKSLPLVGQACVVGDGRRYLVALLVLDPEVAPAWAAGQGLPTGLAELAAAPRSGPSWSAAWPSSTPGSPRSRASRSSRCCRTSGCPTPRSSPRR